MPNINWKQCVSTLIGGGIVVAGPPSAGATNQALNTAYTYGTGGSAVGLTFTAAYTGNLTDFSFYVPSVNGTGGNLSWEIRFEQSASSTPASGTPVASGSIGAISAAGYYTVSGLSVSLVAGGFYWLIIYDGSTAGTNYATVRVSAGTGVGLASYFTRGYQTTNGFTTSASGPGTSACVAIKQNGVWYGGQYVDTNSNSPTGAYSRGTRFKSPVSMTLAGCVDTFGGSGVVMTGSIVTLYDDTGTSLWSFTFGTQVAFNPTPFAAPYFFDSSNWYDIAANTWYIFAILPPSSQSNPRKLTGPASAPAGWISAAMPLGGQAHYTDNNGGSFDKTQTQSMCSFGPMLVPGGAASGGGGTFGSMRSGARIRS